MKTAIIVQARMTSTRLPGKVLKEVMAKPLLEYQLERLRRVSLANDILIATTVNDSDQPIINFCQRLGVNYYRGSEEDVLSRYYFAASQAKADIIVRVTSDCPLIDPKVVNSIIAAYQNGNYDYVSNTLQRTYPRGLDTEVFSADALNQAFNHAKLPMEREHVTPYIYNRPDLFNIHNISFECNTSQYRWTVDTPEDYELICRMITELYPYNNSFDLADCLELIDRHPEWALINQHIEQKKE